MSSESSTTGIEAEVLKRLVRPQLANLTPEAARAILELRLADQDRARVHELSEKAQGVSLIPAEEQELEFYLRLARVVELLWSKARQSLKKAGLDVVASRDAQHPNRLGGPSMSTTTLPRYHIGEILGRIVGPEAGDLPPEAARAILRLKMHDRDRRKLEELLVKNREEKLTPVEQEELDDYLRVGSLMDLLRAKSFGSLKRAGIDPFSISDE